MEGPRQHRAVDEAVVNRHISPADQMLSGAALDREYYFRCGRSALERIQSALAAASIPRERVRRILDLPCGHGRVLRYLRAAFPEADIAACDLLRDGVDFCASTFGATAVYSCDEPEAIPLAPDSFDTGFGYAKYLGSEGYFGLSLAHPSWVIRQQTTLGGLRLVGLSERSWVEFHDVVAAVRDPECDGNARRTSSTRYLRHMVLDRMNPHVRSCLERLWSWR